MIYVVEILGKKFIKIGFSGDESVEGRVAQLQTGNPFEVRVVCVVEGTLRQERAIHSALNAAFARTGMPCPPNEWYPGRSPVMEQFVENLKFGADMGLAWAEKFNPAVKQPGKSRPKKPRSGKLRREWPKGSKALMKSVNKAEMEMPKAS